MPARTHGQSGTPLYGVWLTMKNRCYRPETRYYEYYGGRGIKVCDEWLSTFVAFATWAKESGYTQGLHIDRIDNDGDYSPENCRWVSPSSNARNRSSNVVISAFGESKTLIEWCEDDRCVASFSTLHQRLKLGWNPEAAISRPVRGMTDFSKTHCARGHNLAPDRIRTLPNGHLACKDCAKENAAKYREKRRVRK